MKTKTLEFAHRLNARFRSDNDKTLAVSLTVQVRRHSQHIAGAGRSDLCVLARAQHRELHAAGAQVHANLARAQQVEHHRLLEDPFEVLLEQSPFGQEWRQGRQVERSHTNPRGGLEDRFTSANRCQQGYEQKNPRLLRGRFSVLVWLGCGAHGPAVYRVDESACQQLARPAADSSAGVAGNRVASGGGARLLGPFGLLAAGNEEILAALAATDLATTYGIRHL